VNMSEVVVKLIVDRNGVINVFDATGVFGDIDSSGARCSCYIQERTRGGPATYPELCFKSLMC
jgi:hypothetical protein